MLYSILAGIAAYYAVLFLVGVLVNAIAIEGSLIAFATICFVGAYYARNSKFVCRMACTLGGIAVALLLGCWILLPVLQKTGTVWVTILASFVGFGIYVWSRRPIHRRWLGRDNRGNRPAPPFGREWCRWVIAFVL